VDRPCSACFELMPDQLALRHPDHTQVVFGRGINQVRPPLGGSRRSDRRWRGIINERLLPAGDARPLTTPAVVSPAIDVVVRTSRPAVLLPAGIGAFFLRAPVACSQDGPARPA
jgi:hypothetical protein